MMTILVAGGAGYIGSVCCDVLIKRGFRVIIIDDLSEGHLVAIPDSALFVHANLTDQECLNRCFASHKIDAVMHFAGSALVEESVSNPSRYYANNIAAGIMLLDTMVRHGVKKIIYSSTCAVYGDPRKPIISESHEKHPITPYGHSKLRFEDILLDYSRYANLRSIVLRYFNAAGASDEYGECHRNETHLIPRVLAAASGELPYLTISGRDYPTFDGTCVRDFIHVLDIAEAHLRSVAYLETTDHEVFNIGTGQGYSVLSVIKIAREITQRPIGVKFSERRSGDPPTLVADAKKITDTLGWVPRHSSMEEIISSAWKWKLRMLSKYKAGVLTNLAHANAESGSPKGVEEVKAGFYARTEV